jgi:hypothetical protein
MTVVVIPSRAKESYYINNIRRLLRHIIPRNDIVKRIFQKFNFIINIKIIQNNEYLNLKNFTLDFFYTLIMFQNY